MKYRTPNSLQDILSRRPKWILSSGFYFIFIVLLGIMFYLSDRGLPVLDFFKKKVTVERGTSIFRRELQKDVNLIPSKMPGIEPKDGISEPYFLI